MASNGISAKLSILIAGVLFGLGLVISGMSNPGKVIGFLDVAGNWDPTLLVVMVSGLAVTVPAFHLILKNPQPLFEVQFFLPGKINIDQRLLLGAVLFGIGWGIAGFCPGPALAALVSLNSTVLLFVAAMIAGMVLHHFTLERSG
ncbi:MAG: YeeE/YedE family protein [Gammaproteobacteria bacterium]